MEKVVVYRKELEINKTLNEYIDNHYEDFTVHNMPKESIKRAIKNKLMDLSEGRLSKLYSFVDNPQELFKQISPGTLNVYL